MPILPPTLLSGLFLGIDGCRGGWFAAGPGGGRLFSTLAELLGTYSQVDLALIDIPIGLPSGRPRSCDAAARKLLAPLRHHSVFPVPCREAVYARDYKSACALNRKALGKGFPIQTWHILPKIREADHWLRTHPGWKGRLRECHPELAFAQINGGMPLAHAKKSDEGQRMRRALLKSHWPESENIFLESMANYPRKVLAADDILDALVLVLLASRPEERISLPAEPEWDGEGIRMEILR